MRYQTFHRWRIARIGLIFVFGIAHAETYHAQPPAKNSVPSILADKKPQTDPWVFYDGKLSLSVQERLRWEIRDNNFDFDSTKNALTDDDYFQQRFRIGLTAHPSEEISLMGEGQDARELNSKRPKQPGVLGAEGDNPFDLRQSWILLGDIKKFPFTLKAGRMTWNYGDQRLIGDFDWNNIGRTFDGCVGHAEVDVYRFDIFYGNPVIPQPTHFDHNDGHDQLFGVYFSTQAWMDQTTEFYTIFRKHKNNVNNGQAQETWTPGVRLKSLPDQYENWDYEMELAGQMGKVYVTPLNSVDHDAFASHIQGGYTWKETHWRPRVGALYDYASGDDNPNDHTDTSFQNLFPTNHKFYGMMDLFAWRNIHDFNVNFSIQPAKDLSARLDIHSFWLDSTEDAWYRANGFTTIRPASAGRNVDSHVGEELDVVVSWKVNRFLSVSTGGGQFWTGGFVSATGTSSNAQFVYVMLTSGF